MLRSWGRIDVVSCRLSSGLTLISRNRFGMLPEQWLHLLPRALVADILASRGMCYLDEDSLEGAGLRTHWDTWAKT